MKSQLQNKEEWKSAPGYEGYYEVSNLGNLRSVTADLLSTFQIKPDKRGQGGAVYVGKRGYPVANLRKNGTVKSIKVHRLVAKAFIPNPNNLPYVNHKDGDKTNNQDSNLEWVSAAENVQHAFNVLGFKGSAYGTKGGTCSKKVDQFTSDGIYLKTYASATEAATIMGVTTSAISNCVRGKSKSCAGYIWKTTSQLEEQQDAA